MLRNEVSTAGAIFSLKQLGWSDRLEQTNKDAKMPPEDMQAHHRKHGPQPRGAAASHQGQS
jgi:hypothetical protein